MTKLIIALAVAAVLVSAVIVVVFPREKVIWGETVITTAPAEDGKMYRDDDMLLVEVSREQPVKAMLSGIVTSVREQGVSIITDEGNGLFYRGISPQVKVSQKVTVGDVIGKVTLEPSSQKGEFRVRFIRDARAIVPQLPPRP